MHVLAMAMAHTFLTREYEDAALISAMPVWALLITCIDVDVDGSIALNLVGMLSYFFNRIENSS